MKLLNCSLSLAAVVFYLCQFSSPAQAAALAEYTPQNAAEEWVLERVIQGEEADLSQAFDPGERVISSAFLEYLLTDPKISSGMARQGIRIYNARFKEPVDLNNAEISPEVWLIDTRFDRAVDMADSHFARDLVLSGSIFNGSADFYQLRIDGNGFFDGVVFRQETTFNRAEIGGNLSLTGSQFIDAGSTADFDELRIGSTAYFNDVNFFGEASFLKAWFGLELSSDRSHFFKSVSFNTLNVGEYAFFRAAVFHAGVNFQVATIGYQLNLSDARFLAPDTIHQFDYLSVGNSLYMWDAVLSGGIDFYSANIGKDFFADRARFTSKDRMVNFYTSQIGNNMSIEKAEFAGPVYFNTARIGNNLEGNQARFTSAYYGPVFDYVTVGNSIYFRNASFSGDVSMGGCHVGADLYANEASFLSPDVSLYLTDSKIGSAAWFRGTLFMGKLEFYDSEMADLLIWGSSNEDQGAIPEIEISRIKVTRDLRIEHLTVGALVANSLVASGSVQLTDLALQERAELENSLINTLIISNVTWPGEPKNFVIGGMNYQRILIDDQPPSTGWPALLSMIDQAAYDGQIYKNLENYIRREGNAEAADRIFIQQRRRERSELNVRSSLAWWWNRFLEIFVLYGKRPGRAFLWSLFIVLIGTAVFRREIMIPRTEESPSSPVSWRRKPGSVAVRGLSNRKPSRPSYSAFWYSLDLFLPIVDLKTAENWMPDPSHPWVNHYQKIHILIGWLLVSIGVLAVSGIVS